MLCCVSHHHHVVKLCNRGSFRQLAVHNAVNVRASYQPEPRLSTASRLIVQCSEYKGGRCAGNKNYYISLRYRVVGYTDKVARSSKDPSILIDRVDRCCDIPTLRNHPDHICNVELVIV